MGKNKTSVILGGDVEFKEAPVIQGLQYPVSFVDNAGPNNTLNVGQKLVLVFPAWVSDVYERINMVFHTEDLSGLSGIVNQPFVSGQETRGEVKESKPFTSGQFARISTLLKPKDDHIWHKMPDSVTYEYVD